MCETIYGWCRISWVSSVKQDRNKSLDQRFIIIKLKEEIQMAKAMSIILGLAFLALGILGLTGIIPMFTSTLAYVNIGEIILGGLGLLAGIFTRM
jgi:hypothetical protein